MSGSKGASGGETPARFERPASVAGLKRYLTVGAELRCTFRFYLKASGDGDGTCDQYKRVARAQTNAVQFAPDEPGKQGGWVCFDTQTRYEFDWDGYRVFSRETGVHLATYIYLIHEPDCEVSDGSCGCSRKLAHSGPNSAPCDVEARDSL